MSTDSQNLDDCGCCGSGDAPDAIYNAPGLAVLSYRVGKFAQFRDRMLRTLPSARANAGSDATPLEPLTVRTTDDPTVALVDAVAVVADVLTFYQERIANEGYLRTSTERFSVLELAREIGYELSPGVSASTHLSFTVEDAPGSPRRSVVAKGTQIQSVPAQGKAPQIFETSAEFIAQAEWNRLRPRLTRPADVAILVGATDSESKLVLLVPAGSVPTENLAAANVTAAQVRRLSGEELGTDSLDAVEVSRVYLTEASSSLAKGDVVLFAGGTPGERRILMRKIVEVLPEPDRKRVRVDIEPLGGTATGTKLVPYGFSPVLSYAKVKLAPLAFSGAAVSSSIGSGSWRERDLSAMISIQNWNHLEVAVAANAPPPPPVAPPQSGVFSFRDKTAFFGNNAPRWGSLPNKTSTNAEAFPKAWDKGEGPAGGVLAESRTIWSDSQGTLNRTAEGVDAYLERPVVGTVPGSWIVLGSKTLEHRAWAIHNTIDMSRADFGVSGRTTALLLADPSTGQQLAASPTDAASAFSFREAIAYVGSNRHAFAEMPIEAPVLAGTVEIELNSLVLGLAAGQPVIFSGERSDTPGVKAAEVANLKDVIHTQGRTVLVLEEGLRYPYVRAELGISANVVHATHGETVHEVLGNGDAARRNQRFTLSKPPLTYVSAPTSRGSATSLEVRVNDVLWMEEPSLYEIPPAQPAYVVRIDDDARAQITFGDGEFGARLPSGAANIKARYRSGIGADGEVDAGSLTVIRTLPLGIRGVTNPLAASGAEDPEKLSDARRNAPLTVLTFERVVSLVDFEDFSRTWPGVGKATCDVLWVDGASVIHVTVAGATGGPAGDDVIDNLVDSLGSSSDGSQRVLVSNFVQRFFNCTATVAVDKRYRIDLVLNAVSDRIRAAFSFGARQLAQPVTPAEVLSLMHEVPGVVAVDLDQLTPYTEDSAATPAAVLTELAPLVAQRARWDNTTRTALPAELLLVNPVGIDITEMIV